MTLLFLLLVPALVGVIGVVAGAGKVTVREFLVQEAVALSIVGAGYALALSSRSSDVEHWNGVITSKTKDEVTCCHDYCCSWGQCCTSDSKGNQSCSPCCQAYCKEHSHDNEWNAVTSNGELVFHNTCNSPYSSPPARWTQIRIGEPTTVEHSFTNYIKGNPDSILRRRGAATAWGALLPPYPEVYDYYRSRQLVQAGLSLPDEVRTNAELAELNGSLGRRKQINIIIVATTAADRSYAEGLREHWLGGKKNDLVVIVSMPRFPEIGWAEVLSWSRVEEMKIEIRDAIQALPAWDGHAVVGLVGAKAERMFVRRHWEDFDYLRSTIEPSETAQVMLFALGIAMSLGLTIVFRKYDVFNEANRIDPRWRKIASDTLRIRRPR